MDSDLAFCLDHFIDEQVQLIDDHLEKIKKEEVVEYRKIEKEQNDFNRNKPIPKDKGSHGEDEALVKQFVQDIRVSSEQPGKTRTVIDDQSCIDTLRAELSTKVNACMNYIIRLRNVAHPLPNSSKFVQACNNAIDYFRGTRDFEINFESLYTVLEQSASEDAIQNIHKWWKDTYGSTIADINRRNLKFNAAITENNFAILTPTSRVISNGKKLIAARQIIAVEPDHFDIVRKFVRRLLSIDEEKRDVTNPDELVDQLNNSSFEEIINYAENWLRKRDEVRNHKEVDPYEVRMEEAKADYGRKRIAQEAKKLALAALLCRLAIGSENEGQFGQQLKKTVDKHRKNNDENIPIISGDIKNPEEEDLPIIIQLEVDDSDMDQWENNVGGIRERFLANLCEALGIPSENIRIDGVDQDKAMLFLCVLPPYGKIVVDRLNGGAPDAAARMQAVRKCCLDIDANVESITLGEFGLDVADKLMDPRWNKKYGWPGKLAADEEHWATPLNRGGKLYYCPSGWKRFGVKVAENEKEFDARWGNWYIAYHGTRDENASKILTSGLKVSTTGCFYDDGVPRVYVSPSIEYCAHPRYAFPWKRATKNGETRWYQLVFQCRVNPAAVDYFGPETLIANEYKATVTIDPNFSNGELEWIILGKTGDEFIKDNIICYGLLMRVVNVDPATLTPSAWWKKSHLTVTYQT